MQARSFRSRPSPFRSSLLPSVCLALLAGGRTAQQPASLAGGPPYVEAWVDPCSGSDVTGTVDRPDLPFKTIARAQFVLRQSSVGISPANPGLVHCNPGVYESATGEILPVRMWDNIHVQGLGAKRCILRGDQTEVRPQGPPWYPLADPSANTRVSKQVLLDFSFLVDPSYHEMFDGFTFQGGHVQVYAETEGHYLSGRVSNCVFDLLDQSDVGVPGPDFGVLMVHTYDWEIDPANPFATERPDPPAFASTTQLEEGYYDVFLHLLNNTFIQGWDDAGLGIVRAKADSVAICDVANTLVNDPAYIEPVPDSDGQYRGVGNPNLQNNLIRYVSDFEHTALLGIDDTDVQASVGVPVGRTNAFDPFHAVESNGVYTSLIMQPGVPPATGATTGNGVPPLPKVVPMVAQGATAAPQANPAFVGEYLSHGKGLPTEVSRDWRILPDSILVDQGSYPQGLTVLRAANGTAYDVTGRPVPEWSFVHDGEHYGNFRIQGVTADIGFDESDSLILAGAYTNDSTAQVGTSTLYPGEFCIPEPSCPLGTCPSSPVEIYPEAGTAKLYRWYVPTSKVPGAASFAWGLSLFPAPYTQSNLHPDYPFAAAWVTTGSSIVHVPMEERTVQATTWTTPDDGVVHSFGIFDGLIVFYQAHMNVQTSLEPSSNPNVKALSNVQSTYQ